MHADHPTRRASDHGLRRVLTPQREDHLWDPARGGQLLLVATAVLTLAANPAIHAGLRALAAANVVLVAVLVCSVFTPWRRLSRRATMVFPITAWTAIAVLGEQGHGVGATYLGVFFASFLYIGVVHEPRTGLATAPIAALMYLAAYDRISVRLVPGLITAMITWVLVAETVAALQQRRAQLADKIRQHANIDELTRLPNRADLDIRLASARPGDLIVVCDLDHFQRFNETFGLSIGDQVLADYGFLLSSSVRAIDYAARIGGEQFVMLLPRTELALAPAILGRLRRRWSLLRPNVTFTSGVACCYPGRTSAETLAAAERALFLAKKAGRNRDHSDTGPLDPASDLELDNGFVVGSVDISHQLR
jgi:diguanylate cyclase (GGDEF)-like protein